MGASVGKVERIAIIERYIFESIIEESNRIINEKLLSDYIKKEGYQPFNLITFNYIAHYSFFNKT